MKLVFPSLFYKEKAVEFINEFYEYNSDINGSGGLDVFIDFIEKVKDKYKLAMENN